MNLANLNPFKFMRRRSVEWLVEKQKISLQIDITNACNLSCSHCYHPDHKNAGALDFESWKTILIQYKRLLKTLNRAPSIILCGGEPLASPMAIPLLDWVSINFVGCPITVLTNGTILSDEILERLSRYRVSIQISIDGPDAESHNSVRGRRAFERSLKNITRLQEAGLEVSLLAILSKRTSIGIRQFFEMAANIGVSRLKFTRFIPSGSGKVLVEDGKDRPLRPDELHAAYIDILNFSRQFKVATNSNKALFHLIDRRLGEHEQFGFNGIVVDYKGNMKVSSRIPLSLGNLLTGKPMQDVFLNHPIMRDLRNPKKQECGLCPNFRRCGGSRNSAWAETGNLFAKDPSCWLSLNETKREKLG